MHTTDFGFRSPRGGHQIAVAVLTALAACLLTATAAGAQSADEFGLFDMNGDGEISVVELGARMGGDEAAAASMLGEMDTDGSGTASFAEYEALMAARAAQGDPDEDARAEFAVYDRDGDGEINKMELGKTLVSTGQSADAADDMIAQGDGDASGTISFDEFKALTGR
ncbi:EF-hand domain-containing protein [Rubrimonas cliftonensis]|uniref:Calmodulin n=1 Tax=Rubrimonas cliftonensis TaxID=89524 RepID=A0A1H4GDD5_9RHOB|nr:EF-hand domain-containing protein [Rubrimonas cliftonensis]SEB07000.1 calmodulin [Rubrimonas cliftonensis]